jgi:ribulose-phosphate 3-epimerase
VVQVVPNILTNNINEFKKSLYKLKDVTSDVHIDILDGKFAENLTVNISQLKRISLLKNFNIYLHLMVKNPAKYFLAAQAINPRYVIFHYEEDDVENNIKKIRKLNIKAGLAIDNGTKVQEIGITNFKNLDLILVMTIKAGFSGQKFNKSRLKEIKNALKIKKQNNFAYQIAADGGINEKTIRLCVESGATICFMQTAFWKYKNLKQGLINLKKAARAT